MVLKKAIVLSYMDFHTLVADFFDYLIDFAKDGLAKDIRKNPLSYVQGFFIDGLLDSQRVDVFVIYTDNDFIETNRADYILRLIKYEYGDNWLDDVIGEYEKNNNE